MRRDWLSALWFTMLALIVVFLAFELAPYGQRPPVNQRGSATNPDQDKAGQKVLPPVDGRNQPGSAQGGNQKQPEDQADDRAALAADRQTRYAMIQTIMAGVGLAVTLVLLYYTELSLRTAREANEAAKSALFLVEGATVEWEETVWQMPPGSTRGAWLNSKVTLLFRNFGNTPALNFTHRMFLGNPKQRQGGIDFAPITVAPGQQIQIDFDLMHQMFPPDTNAAFVTGAASFGVWGRVEYDDVFGRHHLKAYAAVWMPGTGATFTRTHYEHKVSEPHQKQGHQDT